MFGCLWPPWLLFAEGTEYKLQQICFRPTLAVSSKLQLSEAQLCKEAA